MLLHIIMFLHNINELITKFVISISRMIENIQTFWWMFGQKKTTDEIERFRYSFSI